MAMTCPACGAKNLEGLDQCANCGTDLRTVDLPKPASEAEASVMHLPLTTLSMTQVHAIPPDATLDAAVQTITRQKLDFLEIVDGDSGKLLGVFSVRDVVTRVGPDYQAKLQQPVSDFMTRTVETLPPDAPITFALNRMDVGGYRHVPVVVGGGGSRVLGGQHAGGVTTAEKTGQSAGHILGIVSSRDVLAYLVKHSHEHVATEGVTTSHGVRHGG